MAAPISHDYHAILNRSGTIEVDSYPDMDDVRKLFVKLTDRGTCNVEIVDSSWVNGIHGGHYVSNRFGICSAFPHPLVLLQLPFQDH